MNRVCGVVVTYNCSSELPDNIRSLRGQIDELVIVDNGSIPASLQILEKIQNEQRCHILLNGDNLGIAAALNMGAAYARENNCDWIATFDQDSHIPEGFIASALEDWSRDPARERIAMVIPRYFDRSTGAEAHNWCKRVGTLLIGITSGALTRLDVLIDVGMFRDSLFIDCVDTEFCLRLARQGWVVVQSRNAILHHSLGDTLVRKVGFGRIVTTPNHSPLRRYYIARNRLWLWRTYFWSYPRWAVSDILFMGWDLLGVMLIEPDSLKKLRFTILGFGDALRNRFGIREADTTQRKPA
jgi:rhamnosyltransferase